MRRLATHWELKQVRRQLAQTRSELHELRVGYDVKRWPQLIRELQTAQRRNVELERDAQAAREALQRKSIELAAAQRMCSRCSAEVA